MTKPRLGFLGVGRIGRQRMEAMLATGAVEAAAICDSADEMAAEALSLAPGAVRVDSLEAMVRQGLDGVVVATPSAQHAAQSIQALDAGAAVFCQKPLGRSAGETEEVVAAARRSDRLLGVDLSYRHTEAMQRIAAAVKEGEIGQVFAIDLTFHNAYGPGKPWFFDRRLSGGGCVIDLGVHLVDLALWTMNFPGLEGPLSATLLREGVPLDRESAMVEDYAVASFALAGGQAVRLACSWNLPAGQDAVIEAAFYGTRGGLKLRNLGGSFYDLAAERLDGTTRTSIAMPPDDWGGRAAAAWARQLAAGSGFDPRSEWLIDTARVLDRIYAA
jgi:predicted dehydrogenase